MKVGDLVRVRGWHGMIIHAFDCEYWGETAKVLFFDGTVHEWQVKNLTAITPLKCGGYAIDEGEFHGEPVRR